MMTPTDIREWAGKRHGEFLRAIAAGETFFPKEVRFGRPSPTEDFGKLKSQCDALAAGITRVGYRIEWEERNTARWGRQRFPVRVWFEDEAGFTAATGKADELAALRACLELTRVRCPVLEEWVWHHPGRVVEASADWTRVLNVCNYFLVHPRPGLYARQLPIAVPTKFIDDRRELLRPILDFLLGSRVQTEARTFNERFGLLEDEPHVRLRFLDDALRVASGHPVPDATLPVGAVRGLALYPAVTVVVENKMCFLTLPPLPNAVALWGSGKAAALLHTVGWLRRSRLIYWGDMDDTGFNILSRLRAEYPQTESMLMDVSAWQAHSRLAHPGNLDFHTPERLFLTPDEEAAWRLVREGGHLIEQEQIPLEDVNAAIWERCGRLGD